MTVYDNVAFPLRAAKRTRGLGRQALKSKVMESLDRVQLAQYADRMASKLSGGQQQRLALSRALVGNPTLLLLDEPLSNLDAALREAMRAELRTLQRETGVTTLYVTHDQTEALSMSNRVAVMKDGKIVQAGSPREIYRRPTSAFVATFVGRTNLFDAKVLGPGATSGSMALETEIGIVEAVCPDGVGAGEQVSLSIRPEDLLLHTERPDRPNVFDAAIQRRMYLGEAVEYHLQVGPRKVDTRQHGDVFIRRRQPVMVEFPVAHCVVLSDEHGSTLDLHADRGSDDDESGESDGSLVTSLERAPVELGGGLP
jgi:iron(III) transport system ATP-binding protein